MENAKDGARQDADAHATRVRRAEARLMLVTALVEIGERYRLSAAEEMALLAEQLHLLAARTLPRPGEPDDRL